MKIQFSQFLVRIAQLLNSYHTETILSFVLCCLNENVLPVYVGERKSVFQITKMIAVAMQKKKKGA